MNFVILFLRVCFNCFLLLCTLSSNDGGGGCGIFSIYVVIIGAGPDDPKEAGSTL
jgi:hypothetical protein